MNYDDDAKQLMACFGHNRKVIAFGNGGSAAQASHFVGELVGRYRSNRVPLPAIALTDPAVMTCIANDFGYERVFSRQVVALANPGDIVVAFSTSGTSPNVLAGLVAARSMSAHPWLVTGENRTPFPPGTRICCGQGASTGEIQEASLRWIHEVCEYIEDAIGVG